MRALTLIHTKVSGVFKISHYTEYDAERLIYMHWIFSVTGFCDYFNGGTFYNINIPMRYEILLRSLLIDIPERFE
jgi:hypothetical protein